jgi:serine/threonine-protein kinase
MAADLNPGSDFSGYRVEALIGRGGMGSVYHATAPGTGRAVALKVIAGELASDPYFRQRFAREARLAATLDHPHVVPIIESGEWEGRLFIVMPLIDGLDLHAVIASAGPLAPRAAAAIVAQVGAALDAAHARGLLHRDVKPGNVLVEGWPELDHAYLTDFGLSKHVLSQSGLTRTGRWVGTVDYAAPEQLQAGEVDYRVDVYALGCVLFQALTASVPFPKERQLQKMIAHISQPPPLVSALMPGLEAFDEVVRRAMAKRPEDRYASAGELGAAAVAAAESVGDVARAGGGDVAAPVPPAPGDASTAA